MYQWIFFDWDGCIADSLESWVTICQKALCKHNITASREEVWEKFCIGNIPKQFGVEDQLKCREDIGILAREEFHTLRLNEGAAETLRTLATVKQAALVTNARRSIIDQLLKRHHLGGYFELIVTQETVSKLKPHAAGIKSALTFFNALPTRSVMIGDSDKDLQAAYSAGIDSILFYPPHHHELYDLKELMKYKPKHVVSNFQELSNLVI